MTGLACTDSVILCSLPPPAVDVQMRALCTGPDDERGVELLHCMLIWISQELQSGRDFEVLQAYLYRLLFIYADSLVSAPQMEEPLRQLSAAQDACCKRFRQLVQSNLCVLKMMAQISSI
jgi:hypothetical protein